MELEYVALGIVAVLAVAYFVMWLRTRRTQNGFRADLTETVVGQLTSQTVQKKGKTSAFGENNHKLTQVTYSYQADHVTHYCQYTLVDHFKPVPASTKVVFQRKRPQMAYLPEFEQADVKGLGLFYLSGSVLFVILAVLYVIFAL